MRLFVEESGTSSAPSIVFLHGAGASGWMWKPQITVLTDFHCLNVDLPGHGKSNAVEWVSLAETSQQIAEIIQTRATNGQAHVVGLSLGGYLALTLLEQHAEVLNRVVISGVTVAPMPNRSLLGLQLGLLSVLFKWRWFVRMQARALSLSDAMQKDFTENLLAMSMDAYRRIAQEAVTYRVPPSLGDVAIPTLVTAGSRESKIILDAVEAIPKLMPHAQGRFAPGVGHGWNVEAPTLFNAMVRAWINDAPLTSALTR